jgi:hypothetical protein
MQLEFLGERIGNGHINPTSTLTIGKMYDVTVNHGNVRVEKNDWGGSEWYRGSWFGTVKEDNESS